MIIIPHSIASCSVLVVICVFLFYEKFEDIKVVIRSRELKKDNTMTNRKGTHLLTKH